MTLDDLIGAADPACDRPVTGGTADDARRLIDLVAATTEPGAEQRDGDSRSRRPRLPRPVAGVLVPACGVLVAVIVAGLVLLGHNSGHTPASSLTRPARSHGETRQHLPHRIALGPNVALDHRLIGEFGVFRQPQTAAARAFNGSFRISGPIAKIVPTVKRLTRAIALPDHVMVYLFVAQRNATRMPRLHRKFVSPGGLGVHVSGRYQGFGYCCGKPQELLRPAGPQSVPYTMSQKPDWVYFELVPDRVTRVQWTYTSTTGRHTVNVPIRDNVAAVALPSHSSVRTDTWYDANGRMIASHPRHSPVRPVFGPARRR